MTKLELKLTIIFYNAKTLNGCRAGLKSLDCLERQAATVEDSDTIKDCMDFLFVRSNIAIARERTVISHIKGVGNKLENLRVVTQAEES